MEEYFEYAKEPISHAKHSKNSDRTAVNTPSLQSILRNERRDVPAPRTTCAEN